MPSAQDGERVDADLGPVGPHAVALVWPSIVASRLDRAALRTLAFISAAANAGVVLFAYETPSMLFQTSHAPAAGLAAATAATVAPLVAAVATRRVPWSICGVPAATFLVYSAGAACLWTLAAAILGTEQLVVDAALQASVHDHFQQGHVLVSISWVLIGLALVVLSLRGDPGPSRSSSPARCCCSQLSSFSDSHHR